MVSIQQVDLPYDTDNDKIGTSNKQIFMLVSIYIYLLNKIPIRPKDVVSYRYISTAGP